MSSVMVLAIFMEGILSWRSSVQGKLLSGKAHSRRGGKLLPGVAKST
jgi:hypothetical protein